jgi:hypothetical protein
LIYFLLFLCFLSFGSCARFGGSSENVSAARHGARPAAILQTGEHPLWFQLTEEGPLLLESIEDAVYSSPLVPWPLARHIRFFHERQGAIVIAVNRDGFMRLTPHPNGIAMYRFPGGIFRQYTIGGFVFYNDRPAALLYLDDRFLDSDAPFPSPPAWTFNMESNTPFPIVIPALEYFSVEEGWKADTLRLGPDGFMYYRVINRSGQISSFDIADSEDTRSVVRMLRTSDLSQIGEEVSVDVFFNSAPLRTGIPHFSLPPLPEGFVYTGIGRVQNSLFVSWEEQVDHSIGAAGFMMISININP